MEVCNPQCPSYTNISNIKFFVVETSFNMLVSLCIFFLREANQAGGILLTQTPWEASTRVKLNTMR